MIQIPPPDGPFTALKRQITIQPRKVPKVKVVRPPKEPKPPKPKGKPGWYKQFTTEQAHIALGLRTAGWSYNKIRAAFNVHNSVVSQALKRIPDAQETIDVLRERLRLSKMRKSHDVDELLWQRLEKDVPVADAKDVDALFRSAYANEKIQQSLVGAPIKVDVQHAGIQPNLELNQMLVQLGVEGLKELTGG